MTSTLDPLALLLAAFDGGFATRRYADGITQHEHALQSAALAERAGAPDALIAAALLHDVGHLENADGRRPGLGRTEDLRHEDVGGQILRRVFGPDVTAPVVLHVDAKRYLCATDDGYFGILSPGSVHSLELQGGPMSDDEARAFEDRPGWRGAVELRRWDDAAKVPGAATPPLDHYRPLLEALAGR